MAVSERERKETRQEDKNLSLVKVTCWLPLDLTPCTCTAVDCFYCCMKI